MIYKMINKQTGKVREVSKEDYEALKEHPSWKTKHIFRTEGKAPAPPVEAKKKKASK